MQNRLLFFIMAVWASVMSLQAQPQVIITPLDGPEGLNHNKVTDLLVDHRGLLWVSSWAGIFRYDGYRFTEYLPQPGDGNELSSSRLDSVGEDEDGNLWCKSYDKFYCFDVNTMLFKEATQQDGRELRPKTMMGDFHRNGYQLRVFERKLWWFHEQRRQWETLVEGIRFAVIDANGLVWAIMNDGAVNRIEVERPEFLLKEDEAVLSQMKDRQGHVWQGLNDGSIRQLDSRGVSRGYLNRQGGISAGKTMLGRAYCMAETADGTLLFGTRGEGLLELRHTADGYVLTQYRHQESLDFSLSDDNIYSLLPGKGFVLVGTYRGGLNVMTGSGPAARFRHAANGCSNFPPCDRMYCVRSLATDGKVYVMGTSSGLYTFQMETDPAKIKFFYSCRQPDRAASMASNEVTDVAYVEGKGFFVSTAYSGVCRIISQNLLRDQLDFDTWNTLRDAPSNRALRVFTASNGNQWAIFNDCLSMMNDGFTSSNDFLTNTSRYRELTGATPVWLDNGHVLLGCGEGSLEIPLDSLSPNHAAAPIMMTAVRVMGKSIPYDIDSDTLTLESNQRDCTLEFAALYLGSNDKVEYAYRVEGRDSTWVRLGRERTISFFNLPAGTYRLLVKATNNDRVWGPEKCFTILVKPRFWETGWAWLIYALAALLLVGAAMMVVLYIYRLRMNVDFEKRLTDLKLKYFTDISHDLRTPLTLIDGPVTEMLTDPEISETNRGYLTLVHNNAQRMLTLVNQILDFRKIQNQKMHLLIERIDLKAELAEVMDDFRYLADDSHIDFALEDKTREATFIWGDKDKVQKIFFNLLSNAFKYTPRGHRVWLELSGDDRQVSVAVCDTGKGMAQNVAARLFQRFETIIADNYMKSSTGIGLSLVKELVELHHARLSVDSREGEGSRFTVVFQRGNEHFRDDQNTELMTASDRPSATQAAVVSTEKAGGASILVVEDDAEMLRFVSDILGEEYQVCQAIDGQDGLEKASQLQPDLIVTDINMPRMNGWQMVEQLKQQKETSHIPVVLLTANSRLEDHIKGAQIGVDDYLEKPFSTEYLRVRLRAILQKQQQQRQQYMEGFSHAADVMKVELPQDNAGVERRLARLDAELMQKLRDYMEENLAVNTPIQELAEHVGMSRTLFYNKIRAITGQTPIDFYRKYHVERAAQMMREQGLTVSEACYATGFADPKYFSKVFKRFMGVVPSAYRDGSGAVIIS